MEETIGSILADVSRLMRRSFDERARSIGVTRPQWQVLTMLRRHEGIHQSGLADMLDVEPITLCRMVDRLQEAGLVERRRDPADRRIWRLYLGETARDLLGELQPLADAVLAEMLDGCSEKERDALRLSLAKLRQNLSRRSVD